MKAIGGSIVKLKKHAGGHVGILWRHGRGDYTIKFFRDSGVYFQTWTRHHFRVVKAAPKYEYIKIPCPTCGGEQSFFTFNASKAFDNYKYYMNKYESK